MNQYASELAELLPETTTLPRQGIGINVKRLLKLRGHIMALVFAVIAVPACVAIWLLVPKQFVAEATIEFRASVPRVIGDQRTITAGSAQYESYVNTQLSLISGWTILSEVVKDPAVQAVPSIASRGDGAVQYMMKNILMDNKDLTELVAIKYKDADPDNARIVLETILAKYAEYAQKNEEQLAQKRRQALDEKQEELYRELDAKRADIAEKRKVIEVPLGDTPGQEPTETESFRINLAQAESDILKAQTEQRTADKNLERLREYASQQEKHPEAPLFALGIEEKVNQDPNVVVLSQQLATVQQEYSVLEGTYVEGAPQIQVKKHEAEAVQGKVNEVKGLARTAVIQALISEHLGQIEAAKSALDDAEQRRTRFLSLLEEYRKKNVELAQALAEIQDLERRYQDTREYLGQINDQLLELDLEASAPARADIGAVNVPPDPDVKQRLKFLLVALVLASTLGAGIGLLLELSDQNIRSAEDVGYVTELPILANIPHATEDRLSGNVNMARVADDHRGSVTADEYRHVAARILYSGKRGHETKTCVIASPARGDGKTTLACNLAIVLSQADRKVLLVDIDSRTPCIEALFGMPAGPGLAELLSGDPVDHDPDRATEFENLFVLGPGLKGVDLIERLASREINDFLQGAEEIFDHIIIDTPASLLMSEAKLLAPMSDGVVMVVGAGVSSFGMLRRSLRAMDDAGGKILGIVVNGLKHAPGGYMRQNIDMYYEQQATRKGEQIPTAARARKRSEPSIVLVNDGKRRDH